MSPRLERGLIVLVPFVAMATVAVGLRLGAPSTVHAAVIHAAAPAAALRGVAWQIADLEDQDGARSPSVGTELDVMARSGAAVARWRGVTNADGIAELILTGPGLAGTALDLDVRAHGALLAAGRADVVAPPRTIGVVRQALSAWMPFARRTGEISLDVAVLGQRAAPGFPASIWVRATDPNGSPLANVTIAPEDDSSLASARAVSRTDAEGWAELDVTPVGLAVALRLHAAASGGRAGDWTGGIFMSPGGARLTTRARWSPDEAPKIEVAFPRPQPAGYLEIDDAHGRAWATAMAIPDGAPSSDGSEAVVAVPKLAPGLYWAVASSDPGSAATFGPGTSVRPFFVATSDDAALAFGMDAAECARALDPRAPSRRVATCLVLTTSAPVPRWIALDGFVFARAFSRERRARGLSVALGAVFIAMLLEALLVVRAAAAARARLRAARVESESATSGVMQVTGVAIALLVALLGFALLAAFLLR